VADTVLVAEDEPGLLRLASLVLERAGFRVLKAQDGPEAMATLASGPVDVLLLDATLVPTGAEMVLRSLQAEGRGRVGVVVFSGAPLEDDLRALLTSLSGRFLPKPFAPHELIEAVRDSTRDAGRV
jgi:two-component system alkaline phosphatase synthesis response regulator PhoP